MKFNDWVDELGGVALAAEALNEKPRAVSSWYYAERAPGIRAAVKIIKVSDHRVDFNGIYAPIALKMLGFGEE